MMSVQPSLYTKARDELYELQERLVERRREYFKQIGMSVQPGLDNTSIWHGYESSSWRDLFAVRSDSVDFSSIAALKPVKDHYALWQRDRHTPLEQMRVYQAFRTDWAQALNIHPDEIALTRSTTEAMTYGFRGINWQKGQLCLTTNMEHSGGLGALYAMVNRFGVQMPNWGSGVCLDAQRGAEQSDGVFALRHDGSVLSLPTGIALHDDDGCGYPMLADTRNYDQAFFERCLKPSLDRIAEENPGTLKTLFFSSPSYISGIRLPETQLARWAWERGVYTMMDGAHLPGMNDVNLHAMGVDFCAVSSHKWQCGSFQTGLAYLRRGRYRTEAGVAEKPVITESSDIAVTEPFGTKEKLPTDYINPTPMIEFWTDMDGRLAELSSDQRLTIPGITHQDPEYASSRGVNECCRLWAALGRPLVETYIMMLSQYLRWRLSEIRPVTALLAEFRQKEGQLWDDVWRPTEDMATVPVHCRSGMTAWTPFTSVCPIEGYPAVDACGALTAETSLTQQYRARHLLSRLKGQFGISVRTTRCPHQLRIGNGQYSANAMPDVGPVTASSPLRFSTYIYHRPEDVDRLIDALTHPDIVPLYDMGTE